MKPLFLCLLLLCGKALPLFPKSAALFAESAASFPEKPCIAPDTALHPAPDSLSAGPDTVRYRRLGAAVVSGGRAGRFLDRRAAPGAVDWDLSSLRSLPRLLGAADPVRYAQLLPGVQTNNDFSSGLFIHGCDNAHNYTALDGAPVFNAAHLLGLFSVFNPLHFARMRLEKSAHTAAFPNRLGGRVELSAPDSLPPRPGGELEAGLIGSQATLSLPLGKAAALRLSGRGSYLNLLYGPLLRFDDSRLRYAFQDANASLLLRPSRRDRVQLSAYWGGDQLRIDEEALFSGGSLRWQNLVLSARWERRLGRGGVLGQQVYHSAYSARLRAGSGEAGLSLRTRLRETGWRGSLSLPWGSAARWETGASWQMRRVVPDELEAWGFNRALASDGRLPAAHEVSLYSQLQGRIAPRWEGHVGLRATAYRSGPMLRFALDPRAGVGWECSPQARVDLHYGVYHQYLHQARYGTMGLPIDFFYPADAALPPEYAHAFSLALRRGFRRGWSFRLEGYYKLLFHQVEFTGSLLDLFYSGYSRAASLSAGRGKSYGLEFFVEKTSGRLQGWVGYTLGWSLRKFPAYGGGRYFPSSHERRHDLTVLATYRLSRRLTLGANFVFASGTPYTRPESVYIYGQNIVSEYGEPNACRLPDYHRLDLSADLLLSRRGALEHRLNVSAYNVYAARNVLYAYISVRQDEFRFKYMNSLCRLLPSVSYLLKF